MKRSHSPSLVANKKFLFNAAIYRGPDYIDLDADDDDDACGIIETPKCSFYMFSFSEKDSDSHSLRAHGKFFSMITREVAPAKSESIKFFKLDPDIIPDIKEHAENMSTRLACLAHPSLFTLFNEVCRRIGRLFEFTFFEVIFQTERSPLIMVEDSLRLYIGTSYAHSGGEISVDGKIVNLSDRVAFVGRNVHFENVTAGVQVFVCFLLRESDKIEYVCERINNVAYTFSDYYTDPHFCSRDMIRDLVAKKRNICLPPERKSLVFFDPQAKVFESKEAEYAHMLALPIFDHTDKKRKRKRKRNNNDSSDDSSDESSDDSSDDSDDDSQSSAARFKNDFDERKYCLDCMCCQHFKHGKDDEMTASTIREICKNGKQEWLAALKQQDQVQQEHFKRAFWDTSENFCMMNTNRILASYPSFGFFLSPNHNWDDIVKNIKTIFKDVDSIKKEKVYVLYKCDKDTTSVTVYTYQALPIFLGANTPVKFVGEEKTDPSFDEVRRDILYPELSRPRKYWFKGKICWITL